MASKFKTKLISLERLIIGPDGAQLSLCENCQNHDCGNPIVETDVAVFGVKKKAKVYQTNFEPKLVISCEGYVPSKK